MNESVWLRVVFEDASILRGSQRRRGLQKCWLQLRPGIFTIADLAAHIQMTFALHGSCPHGLIISMDGFVLPSFISTCILKDKDIIMIKKSGVSFQDVVKFCGSQNHEQDLQSKKNSVFSNRNLANLVPLVDSQYENDTVPFDRSTVHIETAWKKMNECCKRKRSNELQGSSKTLAIKDSQGDLLEDEEIVSLHENIALKETTSNEMVNAEQKKKHSNKLLTSDTLANKDSQADSQVDKGDLGLPIPHMETSSSDMMKLNRKRKRYDTLQGSDDTRAIKDSQRNSQRKDEANDVHGNTAEKEATSNGMMHVKYKRKHSNKLQASPLKVKNYRGDSQVDDGDLCLPNGKITQKETSCDIKNAKYEGKRSNKPQGSDDTFAITEPKDDSKGDEENVGLHGNIISLRTTSNETMNARSKKNDSKKHYYTSDTTLAVRNSRGVSPGDENEVGRHNVNIALRETPCKVTNVMKRTHSKKLQASGNKSKGNDDRYVSKNDANGDVMKVPSRSARRKKAKRIWHRASDAEKKKLISVEIPEGDNLKKTTKYANADQITKVAEEIVPVIVRPGHMRFESPDTCSVLADEPVETFLWNGTTSKKKGQKWGRENTFKKWNNDTSNSLSYGESSNATEAELVEVPNEKYAVEKVKAYKEPTDNHVEQVKECTGNSFAKDAEAVKELIELESLLPLIHPPEEGDVLAYRMVELSSSWCPEISPFRVGRVSSYDSSSLIVVLLPLPEYPIILEEISEEGQESRSLYREDGILEVEFPSLVDVRLFKARESIETTPSTNPLDEMQHTAPVNNQESSNRTEISSNHTVDNQLSEGLEAIKQALNEKKSQLQNQTELDKRNSSLGTTTTGPWSYRALRRNALGPTLAMLRSSNANTGN